MPSRARKEKYFAKLNGLFAEYERMFIVGVDNVGSRQMQEIKMELRGLAEVLNGKNTQMRRAISDLSNERPELWCLVEELKQNVAFVLTNGDLGEVKEKLEGNQKPAAARAGANAPVDVFIPKGPTGLDPAQTSFFQALNIPTKINKGSIEIIQDVQVIKAGTKVRAAAPLVPVEAWHAASRLGCGEAAAGGAGRTAAAVAPAPSSCAPGGRARRGPRDARPHPLLRLPSPPRSAPPRRLAPPRPRCSTSSARSPSTTVSSCARSTRAARSSTRPSSPSRRRT